MPSKSLAFTSAAATVFSVCFLIVSSFRNFSQIGSFPKLDTLPSSIGALPPLGLDLLFTIPFLKREVRHKDNFMSSRGNDMIRMSCFREIPSSLFASIPKSIIVGENQKNLKFQCPSIRLDYFLAHCEWRWLLWVVVGGM